MTPTISRGAIFSLLFSSALGGVAASPAAETAPKKAVGPFTGTVLDPAGKPVAGAKVWLTGGGYYLEEIGHLSRSAGVRVLAETNTDEKGHFRLAEVKWGGPWGCAGSPTLMARDERGNIGGRMPYDNLTVARKRAQDVEIRLHPVKDYRGRLVDLSGHPIGGAGIQPQTCVYQPHFFTLSSDSLFVFPPELSDTMAARTDADGRFTIHGVPTDGETCFVISADGFGKPVVRLNMARLSTTIQLGRTGEIRGTVTCAKDAKAAAGLKIRINLDPRRTVRNIDCATSYYADVVTQQDGAFRFANLPPGRYSLQPELPKMAPYYTEDIAPVEVKSGATNRVAVTLKPAVKVQGKAVDLDHGAGVADVRVSLYFRDRKDGGRYVTTTAEDGTFTQFVGPGKADIQVYLLTDDYFCPAGYRQVPLTQDTRLEPFVFQRKSVLKGIVVDTAGSPVPHAEIFAYQRSEMAFEHFDNPIRSNVAGEFAIQYRPYGEHIFHFAARAKNVAAQPVDFIAGKEQPPVRLVLDEKISFALRGTVVDDTGRPILNAEIVPTVLMWLGNGAPIVRCDSAQTRTNADGHFEIRGLWPGCHYDLRITARGYDSCGSRQVAGTPSGAHDCGRFMLIGSSETVEGRVVDSSDKPLAGVRVFNSGDGARPMETESNAAGHFRLEGFHKGPVFVFAEKEGYRFAGTRTAGGANNVVLKLLRPGERPPRTPVPLATSPSDVEKQCATKLRQKLLAAGANVTAARRPLSAVAEEDLEEAFSTIPREGPQAYWAMTELAFYFAESDPAKAMRCAGEAVVRARTLDQPERTVRLAELSVLVARLGNKEAAEKLAREAADVASMWMAGKHDREFGPVAVAVAPYDLLLATRLLGKISEPLLRSLRGVEVAAAAGDLAKVESLLRDIETRESECRDVRLRVACSIASKHPTEAVRLLEDMPRIITTNDEGNRGLAFGQLARAIAPQHPAMAYAVVDRTFEIFLHPSDRTLAHNGGRAAQAALTAVQAQQIGYADMESLVYRVLATRPTTADATFSPVTVHESAVAMALYLALIDSPTAKQVLQTVEPNADAIGSGSYGAPRSNWLKAWALADPQHAVEVAERELASAKDQDATQKAQNDVMEMVNLWTTAPGERLRYLRRSAVSFTYGGLR